MKTFQARRHGSQVLARQAADDGASRWFYADVARKPPRNEVLTMAVKPTVREFGIDVTALD